MHRVVDLIWIYINGDNMCTPEKKQVLYLDQGLKKFNLPVEIIHVNIEFPKTMHEKYMVIYPCEKRKCMILESMTMKTGALMRCIRKQKIKVCHTVEQIE